MLAPSLYSQPDYRIQLPGTRFWICVLDYCLSFLSILNISGSLYKGQVVVNSSLRLMCRLIRTPLWRCYFAQENRKDERRFSVNCEGYRRARGNNNSVLCSLNESVMPPGVHMISENDVMNNALSQIKDQHAHCSCAALVLLLLPNSDDM